MPPVAPLPMGEVALVPHLTVIPMNKRTFASLAGEATGFLAVFYQDVSALGGGNSCQNGEDKPVRDVVSTRVGCLILFKVLKNSV